ncbi:hypothetical protein B0H14DRAFT_3013648 [Mycena olivaceomarginata]|nr:hypothetical protein B0H14DRAFT_3013648 [Mycena olivaceomarginata]
MAPTHDASEIQPQALTLHFDDGAIWSPGQTLHGHVSIPPALAKKQGIAQVRVDVRGRVETELMEYTGNVAAYRQRADGLFHSSQTIWPLGSDSEASEVVERRFEFALPESLPPSFFFAGSEVQARVLYTIQVVGKQTGLGKDLHIVKNFTVFPAPSPAQLAVRRKLQSDWDGSWRTISQGKEGMRHIHAELKLPDLPSFSRATAVPVILTVETRSKRMDRGEPPEDGSMSPAPPTHAADRTVRMNTEYALRMSSNTSRVRGGLGDPERTRAVKCTITPPEWISDARPGGKDNKGVWKRVVRFEGTITIAETPTFASEAEGVGFELQYSLQFVVNFPGVGNNLELEFPIAIHSAHE